MKFTEPVLVDSNTLAALERLVSLAPLQQPHNLAAIRAVAEHAPQLPQVACFDTSFHRTQPWVAEAFALPRRYTEEGVRRYGFHGLSYEYVASVLPTLDGGAEFKRTVVAHLGNGASMCALRGYKSIAATMGLTAIDGLPMGTRCGSLDPGFYSTL
jgi:acetate kinase